MWMNYLHLLSNKDLTDTKEENKTPPTKAKDDECHSPSTKTFPDSEINERSLDRLKEP
jgi:hypothetical protein